jgi:hypothetical protein
VPAGAGLVVAEAVQQQIGALENLVREMPGVSELPSAPDCAALCEEAGDAQGAWKASGLSKVQSALPAKLEGAAYASFKGWLEAAHPGWRATSAMAHVVNYRGHGASEWVAATSERKWKALRDEAFVRAQVKATAQERKASEAAAWHGGGAAAAAPPPRKPSLNPFSKENYAPAVPPAATPVSASDVAAWVCTVAGIPVAAASTYAAAFIEQDIDAETMDELGKDDLKEAVDSGIHRGKLVAKWKKMRERAEEEG